MMKQINVILSEEKKLNKDFSIIPTTKCDMKCEFCHEKNNNKIIELKNEEVDIFIQNIVKKINNIEDGIPISLFGGEPLLNKGIIKYLSEHKLSKYFDIRIFTNLNKFEFDDLFLLSSFKKVTISTNLDVFQNKLFYKTKKYNKIKYLCENTNIDIRVHCIISKDKSNKLLYYAPKLKKQINYLKEIGLLFDIIFPQENDYTIDEYVNIITFYNYMGDNELFNYNIYKIINFIELTNKKSGPLEFCNINSCEELTLKPDGEIVPCRRFYNKVFTEKEILEIEEKAKKCEECKFSFFCEPCKYSHYGIDNTSLKCNRVINILKALEKIELKGYNKIDEDLFILSINIGNKCNKNCSFCYIDKNNSETIDLKRLKSFLKNNYWKIDDLDTLLGGEPLLYLNEEYEFLKEYFDELHIISNTYCKNEYVRNNSDFIKITMSIQDNKLEKLNFNYYKGNIESSLILLNNEVLDDIFNVIKLLELNNIKYRFIELYSYKKGDNLIENIKLNNILKISKIFKNIKNATFKFKKNEKCINKKINIDKNKLTLCGTLFYGAEFNKVGEKYILSDNLEKYIINKEDIIKITKKLRKINENVCIANQYCVYENIDICEKIRRTIYDK